MSKDNKCNHLMICINWGLRNRQIRQRHLVNSLFRLAKRAHKELREWTGYHGTPVSPIAFLDKRTSWGSDCIKYKYCPDCGTKNVDLKLIKKKLKDKWAVERIIEDM